MLAYLNGIFHQAECLNEETLGYLDESMRPQMKKLKPGQKAFKIVDNEVIEMDVKEYDLKDSTIIMARSKKAAIKKLNRKLCTEASA